jgi:hypothetical protein
MPLLAAPAPSRMTARARYRSRQDNKTDFFALLQTNGRFWEIVDKRARAATSQTSQGA